MGARIALDRRTDRYPGPVAGSETLRALHDDVAQDLFVARTELFELSTRLPDGSAERRMAESAQAEVGRALRRTRELIDGLREADDVFDGDLASTLCRELLDFAAIGGIAVSFSESGSPADLPPESVAQVRGIVREALVNVRKHAGASEVRVHVRGHFGWTRLTVADNGRGLGRVAKGAQTRGSGCGIGLMEQRARATGGRIGLRSLAGSGTVLTLDIPPLEAASRAD